MDYLEAVSKLRQSRTAATLLVVCLLTGCRPSATEGPDAGPPDAVSAAKPDFVGSKTCRDCHEDFYRLWATSHHGLAMQPYTAALAKDKLTPPEADLAIGNRRYRAEITEGPGTVRELGPDGEKSYPIAHVMGGKNVYYFLTPLDRGRLQVLPVAYDVRKKSWYDTAASGVRHFPDRRDEALDWTDRMFTFNTTCFNCHVSELSTNYDLATETYRTTWTEPGINCEACHGPASEHVRAMEAGVQGHTSQEIKILRTKEFTVAQMNDLCATCHAKLIPLSTRFLPGEKFFDHYDLVLLEHPDFYPDGRDLGENYTQTSWLMSPCAKSGNLDCNHCHTPSGRMRFEGEQSNQSCMPCHEKQVQGAAEHSRHPAESTGSRCVACHIPMTRFAAMGRSDHSMRPPTPAATLAFKSPNACNLCHDDRDAAWADGWVREWHFNDYQAEVLRRAELIDAARNQQWQRLPEMLAEVTKKDGDEVYKASLVRLLHACEDDGKWPVIVESLSDPSPLVRSSAAAGLAGRMTPETLESLLTATTDPSRLVRIRSAAALAAVPRTFFKDESDRRNLDQAVGEFKAAMNARPDDWASHANLGNFYMDRRDFAAAVACFETATKIEPRVVGPMVNAAIAHSSMHRRDKAEQSLRRALKVEPSNAAVLFNLGLLRIDQGRLPEAEQSLRAAVKADPKMAAAAFNLGDVLAEKDIDEALAWYRKAHELRPSDANYAYTLALRERQKGNVESAVALLREVIRREPRFWDAYLLLADTYERQGDRKAAAAVCRDATKLADLPPDLRRALEAKLQTLESPKDP